MSEPVRILILEDNRLDAELVVRQLAQGGFDALSPRVVALERDFRAALREFSPHVIVSDFSLPGFDGLTALHIATTEAPGTPFIFVSGTIGEERAIEALKRGASDYVLKDNLNRLVPAVKAALRQAEIVRARDLAEAMLRAREARLRDIINTSSAWIWECDREGRYTFSSPSVVRVLGYDHHEVLGRNVESYCHAEDRAAFVSLLETLADGSGDTAQTTLRCRGKDGRTRWLDRDMVAVRDENGNFGGLRGADRDVSDRKTQELRIQRLNRALRFLGEANSAMLRIRAREELLEEACRIAVRLGGYCAATIYLRPAEGDSPIIRRAVSDPRIRALPKESLDGTGPVARAIDTGRSIVDANHGAAASGLGRERLLAIGVRASAALPLLLDETPVGALHLHSSEAEVFEGAELDLLRQVSGNIAFALKYLHNKDAARFLQYFDPVTALPKRALYLRRLAAAIAKAPPETHLLAVLVLDIKNLSIVNDSLGRAAGDLVLQLVAERLKNHFGDSRYLAHLGGGTYTVVHRKSPKDRAAADLFVEQILRMLAEPYDLLEQEVHLSIRAGVALYPDDGNDAHALLNRAETALSRAKGAGKEYLRHHATMNVEAAERLSLMGELRRAVAEQRFTLAYQPKISLASGSIEGVEALLRWHDPERGNIPPDRFVPMLEAEGMIDEVGQWVVERALKETEAWRGAAGELLPVAVNVSPLQLRRPDFADNVLRLVREARAGDQRLELEITESMLMENIDGTIAMLAKLRERGVSISIDDFGTGYSSLRVLSQLPVSGLKIDRSFVAKVNIGRNDRSVVQTTISLAQALGLKTIAEGVETEEQLAELRKLGCGAVQGFLIRPPLPPGELSAWLAATGGRLPGAVAGRPGDDVHDATPATAQGQR